MDIKRNDLALDPLQRMLAQISLNRSLIENSIRLYPGPPHSRAFAAIEHATMDCGSVGGARHKAIKYIEFAYEMAFAHSTNGWVAAHLTSITSTEAKKRRSRSGAGGSGSGFTAGMACTDYDDIVHRSQIPLFALQFDQFHVKQFISRGKTGQRPHRERLQFRSDP